MRRVQIIVGIVSGVALTAAGLYLIGDCTWSYAGMCLERYYAPAGLLFTMAGLLLFLGILGWAWSAASAPRRPVSRLYCTQCGHELQWLEASDQWYCPRCGAFRLAPTKPQPHHFM